MDFLRLIVTNTHQLDEVVRRMMDEETIAFDTESTGLDFMTETLVGLSFYLPESNLAVYIPVGHQNGEQLLVSDVIRAIKPVMLDGPPLILAHNLKHDLNHLRNYGIDLGPRCFTEKAADTMIAAWMLDENRSNGLKELEASVLGIQPVDLTKKEKQNMAAVPIERAAEYAQTDAWACYALWKVMAPQLVAEKLDTIFWKLEMPMVAVLANMERRGVPIDTAYLQDMKVRLEREIEALKADIFQMAGRVFNLDSPKQLAQVLFVEMGLPEMGRTKTGALKTDEEALKELAKRGHEIATKLLRYRELKKVQSTYVEALLKKVAKDGRIHGQFLQHGTVTGRLSSQDPNLQNQPASETLRETIPEEDVPTWRARHIEPVWNEQEKAWQIFWRVRDAYTAGDPETHTLVVADLSQIELRLMAHFSQDPVMLEAYRLGQDLHSRTAAEMFGVPYEEVEAAAKAENPTAHQKDLVKKRKLAKGINFGLIYGQGPKAFAQMYDLPIDEARDYINRYFARYRGVMERIHYVHRFLDKYGFVKTILGRKRRLPWVHSDLSTPEGNAKRADAQRKGVNAQIQGSVADLMSLAMVRLEKLLPQYGAELLIQVHDELVIRCPKEHAQEVAQLVKQVMETVISYPDKIRVPVVAEVHVAYRWGHAK